MIDEKRVRAEVDVCRLLSKAFANVPSKETLIDEGAIEACACLGGKGMAQTASNLVQIANEITEDGMRAMRVDYTTICCGASADAPLPYSSIYSNEGRFLKGSCCTSLASEYAQNSFMPETAGSNEPEDFLPTLLDYIAFRHELTYVALRNKEALAEEEYAKTNEFKKKYVRFWVPQYCAEARELSITSYYQGILDILEAYCAK